MVKERRRGNYKKNGMKMKWFDVIASGSLLGIDYKRASSYPVGYVDYLKMYGIDFEVKTGFGSNEVKVDRETDWSTDVVLENASDSSQYMKTTMTQGSPMAFVISLCICCFITIVVSGMNYKRLKRKKIIELLNGY